MSDNFNWDDYLPSDDEDREENEENDLFGINNPLEIEKQMFIRDILRGHPIPIDPIEYEDLFGTLTNKDLNEIVDIFFTVYHRYGVDSTTLIDNWGLDWVYTIQHHCEKKEEYELCSILKELADEYQLVVMLLSKSIELENNGLTRLNKVS